MGLVRSFVQHTCLCHDSRHSHATRAIWSTALADYSFSFVLHFSFRSYIFSCSHRHTTLSKVKSIGPTDWTRFAVKFIVKKSKMVRQRFVVNAPTDLDSGNTVVSHLKAFGTRLVARKCITQLQSEANGNNELKRTLGTFQIVALGVGSIIGEWTCHYKRRQSELSDRYWYFRAERRSGC